MIKLKMRAGTRRKCLCGCGKTVRLSHHKFMHGHNARLIPKDELANRIKEGVKKKYGVDNTAHIPGIKEKAVATRKHRYTHWMGNLNEDQWKVLKEKYRSGGKKGGASTAKRWDKNPEEFNLFLEKSHQKQRDNGTYLKKRGAGNAMADPAIRKKHQIAVKKAMNRPEVKEKMRAAAPRRALFTPRKEKHYRWKGGISFKRGLDWNEIRKFVLTRDDNKCVVCRKTRYLHVHHIIPVSSGIEIHFLNDPFNLVTLCRNCHMKHEPTNCFEAEIIQYLNDWGSSITGGLDHADQWK